MKRMTKALIASLCIIMFILVTFTACAPDTPVDVDTGSETGTEAPNGNTDGGNTDGGNTDGGNTDGGNTDGGNTDGGNTDGGNTDGGNTDGGNTDGGNTDGGNTDGGNTDGGNTDGGNTDGGNTDGGNTDGGNTDGGNEGGGSTADCSNGHTFAADADDRFYNVTCSVCSLSYIASKEYIYLDVLYDGVDWTRGTTETQALDLSRLNIGNITSLKKQGSVNELCDTTVTGLPEGYVRLTNLWDIYSSYGDVTFDVVGSNGTTTVTLTLITKIITTPEEYALMAKTGVKCFDGGTAGYFELGCDIKPATEGGNIDCVTLGAFSGIFDGRGYVIDGLKAVAHDDKRGGFVYETTAVGVIKNVGFTNVDLDVGCKFLGQSLNGGTLENIYISVDSYTATEQTNPLFLQGGEWTINNIFIDYSNTTFGSGANVSALLGDARNDKMVEGIEIYGIGSVDFTTTSNTSNLEGHYIKGSWAELKADATVFAAVSAYATEAPSYWKVDADTGMVYFGVTAIANAVPHTHSLTKVDAKAATCTETGNVEYYKCSCGKYFSDAAGTAEITDKTSVVLAIDAANHTGAAQYVHIEGTETHKQVYDCCNADKAESTEACSGGSATCLAKATCQHCGVEYGTTKAHAAASDAEWEKDGTDHWKVCTTNGCTEKVEKAEHDWDDGVIDPEPTETTAGTKTYTCEVCQKTKTETVNATGHTCTYSVHHQAVDADCANETNGMKEYYECDSKLCDLKFIKTGEDTYQEVDEADLVIAWAHTEEVVQGTPASCVAGMTDGKKCTVCQQVTVAQEEIPAIGHIFATSEDKYYTGMCFGGCTNTLPKMNISSTHINAGASWNGSGWDIDSNATQVVDLRAQLPEGFGQVTSMTVSGKGVDWADFCNSSTTNFADGFVRLAQPTGLANLYGETEFTVKNADGDTATVKLFVVTKVIMNEADYAGISATSTKLSNNGYFELGCDIKPATEGGNIDCVPLPQDFAGTFDGCGYVIDGLKAVSATDGRGGFAYSLTTGGVIKNIGFTNVDLPSGLSCKFLGQSYAGTYQNIYFSADDVSDSNFMLVQSMATAVVIDNVFADYTNATGSASYLLGDARNNGLDSADIYGVGSISGWKYASGQSNTGVLAGHYLANYAAIAADTTAYAAISAWETEAPTLWHVDDTTGKVTFGVTAIDLIKNPPTV